MLDGRQRLRRGNRWQSPALPRLKKPVEIGGVIADPPALTRAVFHIGDAEVSQPSIAAQGIDGKP